MQTIEGKRVTVFGLGRFTGGISVARWLVAQGAKVTVADQAPAASMAESVAKLDGLNIDFAFGNLPETLFADADLIVASPAIPPSSHHLKIAQQHNVPITTEILLFIERCPAKKIIGVTGTKGKSTTTAMLGRMLSKSFTTYVGGNIGVSLLDRLDQMAAGDLVVLELSSYMLHHLGQVQWSPHVALLSMIGVDHVEWHGSAEAYIDAKRNILRFQNSEDYAVVNHLDAGSMALALSTAGRVVEYPLIDSAPFSLLVPGAHNQVNAQGAYAAASLFGISHEQAQEALIDFPGLPHRLELVHERDGIRWINDSIATIPEAAVAALESFPAKKVLHIIGGKDKHLPHQAMCNALIQRAKAVLCIGATGVFLANTLEQSQSLSAAAVYQCNDLRTAVRMARSIAQSGDVVLLSPGYPSQDQFVNFEERGKLFTDLTRAE